MFPNIQNMKQIPNKSPAGGPTYRCSRCGFTVCDGSPIHDCNGILEKKNRKEKLEELSFMAPTIERVEPSYKLPERVGNWLVVGYCTCGSPIYTKYPEEDFDRDD
jgi:hypothetical protein